MSDTPEPLIDPAKWDACVDLDFHPDDAEWVRSLQGWGYRDDD